MAFWTSKNKKAEQERGIPDERAQDSGMTRTRPVPGIADHLAGETGTFISSLQPYLPHDLIGGSLPHIPGAEDEAVWNAASQACGTERVTFCYSIDENRVWYLACPSSALASNPDSWCPLAAALPGNSEYWDKETVYLYENEGLASALRWDPETGRMQVFLGAARTILPRIQSMDANFVTVNPDVADVVPWRNRALRTEKLSRAAARVLLLAGLAVNFIAISVLGVQYVITNVVHRDLSAVRQATVKASQDLMFNAFSAMQSDAVKHMVQIQELLDALLKIDGTLTKYEVKGSKANWEALVPKAFQQGVGPVRGQVVEGVEDGSRVRIRGTR